MMETDLSALYQLLGSRDRPVLPSGEHRAVLGCGYVGQTLARQWRAQGHAVTGTTRRASRLESLSQTLDEAILFDSESGRNDLSFINSVDCLVVALAPTGQQHVDLDTYRSVFSRGIDQICAAIKARQSSSPLTVIQLSSCGLYGDHGGALTCEQSRIDLLHPINALLAGSESKLQELRSDQVSVSTLRLGGIYGPGREIPEWLLAAAGQQVERCGHHVPCWVHRDDVVQAVDLIAAKNLSGLYNVVDDLQLSKQTITDLLCSAIGLPRVDWMGSEREQRVLHAAVSNQAIKRLGFQLKYSSMIDWYLASRSAAV